MIKFSCTEASLSIATKLHAQIIYRLSHVAVSCAFSPAIMQLLKLSSLVSNCFQYFAPLY